MQLDLPNYKIEVKKFITQVRKAIGFGEILKTLKMHYYSNE